MDKISINNLCPQANIIEDKPLDISSLNNSIERKNKKKTELHVEDLTARWEEKKRKKFHEYKKIYNMCLSKIKQANKINRFDLLYEIPTVVYMCPQYDSVECLDYLQEKLKSLYLDTMIVNKYSIFISWMNIKENKEKADKK